VDALELYLAALRDLQRLMACSGRRLPDLRSRLPRRLSSCTRRHDRT